MNDPKIVTSANAFNYVLAKVIYAVLHI